MDFFKELQKEKDRQTMKGLILSKVTLFKLLLLYNNSIFIIIGKRITKYYPIK